MATTNVGGIFSQPTHIPNSPNSPNSDKQSYFKLDDNDKKQNFIESGLKEKHVKYTAKTIIAESKKAAQNNRTLFNKVTDFFGVTNYNEYINEVWDKEWGNTPVESRTLSKAIEKCLNFRSSLPEKQKNQFDEALCFKKSDSFLQIDFKDEINSKNLIKTEVSNLMQDSLEKNPLLTKSNVDGTYHINSEVANRIEHIEQINNTVNQINELGVGTKAFEFGKKLELADGYLDLAKNFPENSESQLASCLIAREYYLESQHQNFNPKIISSLVYINKKIAEILEKINPFSNLFDATFNKVSISVIRNGLDLFKNDEGIIQGLGVHLHLLDRSSYKTEITNNSEIEIISKIIDKLPPKIRMALKEDKILATRYMNVITQNSIPEYFDYLMEYGNSTVSYDMDEIENQIGKLASLYNIVSESKQQIGTPSPEFVRSIRDNEKYYQDGIIGNLDAKCLNRDLTATYLGQIGGIMNRTEAEAIKFTTEQFNQIKLTMPEYVHARTSFLAALYPDISIDRLRAKKIITDDGLYTNDIVEALKTFGQRSHVLTVPINRINEIPAYRNTMLTHSCEISVDGNKFKAYNADDKLPKGRVFIKYPDGRVYEGNFVNGLANGKGKMNYPDSRVYEGNFVNGLANGKGALKHKNGIIDSGMFSNGLLNGEGQKTYPIKKMYNIDRCVGTFLNGELHGKIKVYPNQKYPGNYITRDALDYYEADFKHGKKTDGILTYGLGKNNLVNFSYDKDGNLTDLHLDSSTYKYKIKIVDENTKLINEKNNDTLNFKTNKLITFLNNIGYNNSSTRKDSEVCSFSISDLRFSEIRDISTRIGSFVSRLFEEKRLESIDTVDELWKQISKNTAEVFDFSLDYREFIKSDKFISGFNPKILLKTPDYNRKEVTVIKQYFKYLQVSVHPDKLLSKMKTDLENNAATKAQEAFKELSQYINSIKSVSKVEEDSVTIDFKKFKTLLSKANNYLDMNFQILNKFIIEILARS